jgi:CHAT domain-containing protein
LLASAGDDGLPSLVGLARIRVIEALAPATAGAAGDDNFREQLARRAEPAAGEDSAALAREINRQLATWRAEHAVTHPPINAAGLRRQLSRYDRQTALLTFHVDGAIAQAWLAGSNGVRSYRLGNAAGLAGLLAQARENFAVLGGSAFDELAARLGQGLLGPLAAALPGNIEFAPAGPLLGLPLDALRLDGRYLLQQHRVVNRLDLLGGPAAAGIQLADGASMFLAGSPVDYSPDFIQRLDTPPQVRAVMQQFVGPGLHVVQSGALLLDEFEDPRYAAAQVVHLALPAMIDLRQPAQSWLQLSEPGRGMGRQQLRPAQIAAQPIAAQWVWLGDARFTEGSRNAYVARLGLVSDYLAAGAGDVVTSHWPMATHVSSGLVTAVYTAVLQGAALEEALHAAKLQQLAGQGEGARDWAALQLYTD